MDRSAVIAWLSSMTDKQFIDFFYDAVSGRDTSEMEGERGHLVMANASQFPGEDRDTVFLALPDPDKYPEGWADDSPICQTGQCIECGSPIRCVAKHAVCPICMAKVYCT
jgi:hypothetical protein